METMTRKVSQSRQYESGDSSDFTVMTRKVSQSNQYESGQSQSNDNNGDGSKN